MENRKIRVAITQGDINGVGYELLFKAFEEPTMMELCTPIVYGNPKVAEYYHQLLGVEMPYNTIMKAHDAQENRLNILAVSNEAIEVVSGQPTEKSGTVALHAVDRALADYRQGLFDVLVTLPVDNNSAFHFSGLSRYIEDHLDESGRGLSMLVSDRMRIALATRNLPLKQVAEAVTTDAIKKAIATLHTSLLRDFRQSNPRIAVLALNPKAGEDGLLGTEEQEVLRPAMNEAEEAGKQVFGPYAADTFFSEDYNTEFDGVLAMYYDQGLMPFRTTAYEGGVSYTAGLSLVRTAPAHNAHFDIAGKGVADAASLRQAMYLAVDIFRNRKTYDEPLANPLPKLYKERRDDSDKTRFRRPAVE